MRKQEVKGALDLKVHPNSAQKLQAAQAKGKDGSDLFGVMTRKGVAGGWRDELAGDDLLFVQKRMADMLNKDLLKRYIDW
jgi:hypothetical protein